MAQRAPASASANLGWPCLRLEGQGENQRVLIDLIISPGAKRNEVVGWHDGALRLRIAAPPVDGAANEAVRRWLSVNLRLPQADIALRRGTTSRRKLWALHAELDQVQEWLTTLVQTGGLPAPTL